jgi:CheY-like chemotaxis protein
MKKIKSIMIIDDNEVDIFINRSILESLNFVERVQTFSSGQSALNYFKLIEDTNSFYRLFVPQVILLDINMPFINGFTFLEEFEKFNIFKQRPIDIFILTSSIDPAELNKAKYNENISGVISKPLSADKVSRELERKLLV